MSPEDAQAAFGLQTVPVHITNPHELHPAPPPAPGPGDIEVTAQTYVLKTGIRSGAPNDSVIARILDRDPARTQAIIQVSANTYICHTSAQAEAAAADSSNAVGVPQDGFILSNVMPIVLYTNDPLWAVVSADKAAAGILVSVITERRRAG